MLEHCTLCPRACHVNRTAGVEGYCGENATIRLARVSLHEWEEPPISGERGSGTVFFSGCPLHCVYCQNTKIANGSIGKEVDIERLAQIFLEQQDRGAHNINLVTPTHYAPQIVEALVIAKDNGLNIPIVCNTSGYEAESLAIFKAHIDIYLTDFKYASPELAKRYSRAKNYPQVASAALDEMFRQVGPIVMDEKADLLKKGVVVRHLALPGQISDSFAVMRLLSQKPYAQQIIISLMSQYTPVKEIEFEYPELAQTLDPNDYQALLDYALELGLENSYCQEGGAASESFIPEFDFRGI